MKGDVLTVQRVISTPPEVIFGLLADASRHPEIDGSGTVKTVMPGASQRLSKGETFGMSMHQGFKYSTANTVIEFEDDRLIAWQTHPSGVLSKILAGRIWRYELEPVEGGTRVSESWDISQDHQRLLLKLGGLPKKTEANMQRSLERIEQITTTAS